METVWTQDLIDNLGRLWAEGHSTAEIGRRLGLTKNAVVGKAHRLSLAPRPSPAARGLGGRGVVAYGFAMLQTRAHQRDHRR